MFKSTALTVLSLAAFSVVTASSGGDGNMDACDSVILQHVRDPVARILDHLTPSERLLFELDNETNVDPYAFVNNNPVEVNMMLMSEPIVPSPTMSSAIETATSGSDEFIKGDAIVDEAGHEPNICPVEKCTPVGQDCDTQACLEARSWLCYMGTDNQCHWYKVDQSQTNSACANCYCRRHY